MSKAIRLSEDMVGKKVKMVNRKHSYCPENESIGVIVDYDSKETDMHYRIQWDSLSMPLWAEDEEIEEVVDNSAKMTNEEIWQMLKNKMEKNGLKKYNDYEVTLISEYGYKGDYYSAEDVHNVIAIAYRSGYERAMKGRPFKFGDKKEKKQGGHWEPVDPDNLPKEGTRVRYARECKEYLDYEPPVIKVGDTGYVNITEEGWFGIRVDRPRSSYSWLSFDEDTVVSSLDMWVEDNE